MYPEVGMGEAQGETVLSNAAEYVRDKWEAFVGLSPTIIDLQHRAALASQNYRERGMASEADAAKAVIRELGRLNVLHGELLDRFRPLAPYVGLGAVAVPVLVATAFSTAAIVILWFFRKMAIQEKALDMLEAGTLSEAGFLEMNKELGASPLRETFDFAKLALWAFLGWMALQAFTTYRRNPPLVIFGNPPSQLSADVLEIGYIHAEDGQAYHHEFEGGVEAEVLPDGGLLISHPDVPVWRDFS